MKRLMGIMGLLAIMGMLAANAGDFYSSSINVASGLAALTNTTVTSTSGTAIRLPQNVDVIIQPSVVAAGTGTSNVVFGFNLSTDGTNYSTSLPITATIAANGTNTASGWTIISRTNTTGAKWLRLDSVQTTQTNSVTPSALLNYFY